VILEVWADRTRRLQEAGLSYVMPFENRGVEMGGTLQHPHSQIYGYGFVPGRQAHAPESCKNITAVPGATSLPLWHRLSATERSVWLRRGAVWSHLRHHLVNSRTKRG
jgi:Galactose-1-phosphate uridyl transferase, N-terminal domain